MIEIGIVAVDITERKTMELRLKHLSQHDPLTGLYNRRQLFIELHRVRATPLVTTTAGRC